MKYKKLSTVTLSFLSAGLALLGFGACGPSDKLQKEVNSLNKLIRAKQSASERIGRAECVYGGPNLNDGSWEIRKSPEQIELEQLIKRRDSLQSIIDKRKTK
jgi:hypothetical protein